MMLVAFTTTGSLTLTLFALRLCFGLCGVLHVCILGMDVRLSCSSLSIRRLDERRLSKCLASKTAGLTRVMRAMHEVYIDCRADNGYMVQ